MSDHDTIHDDEGASRRQVLKCMTWAGAGVLWTIGGGVPRSLGIIGEAQAQAAGGLTTEVLGRAPPMARPTMAIRRATP